MDILKLKNIIPNSEKWVSSTEITFGWSGEKKFIIKLQNNKNLLLRILTKEQYKEQQEGINFLNKSYRVCKDIPKIYAQGETIDKKYYYLLLSYFEGECAMDCINKYSKKQQYSFGYKMGKIIKKLHNISTPTINKNYTVEFIKKIDNYKNFFIQNKNNFDFLNYSLQEIEDIKYFIKKIPVIMIHNDFHLGNMIINKKDIKLIDFNRATYGNNIKEFDGIAWSAKHSIPFATGLLDYYLKKEDKNQFFAMLKKYILIWQIQMLKFIENEPDEEKSTIINLIKFTQSWFDASKTIPNWYLKNSKLKKNKNFESNN